MELEYLEEIKEDVEELIRATKKFGSEFKACVARVIHENDLYMSSEKPVEMACHYIAIAAYAVITDNIKNLDSKVLDKIKQSYEIINSGRYDKYFTEEDKKYIKEDINTINNSDLLK
ncbi:hypothetical protein J0A94_03770 [Paraclostridium bifermentans]|uniref:Uncharacterized protein n=1 Tax=Paraclostridium bifermentans TaxID=1490 RepID=A0AA44IGQ8_PARBF|nr:hypothetical protein [Paraclostridium bifermentans]MBN8046934.1 hypothetical protein [Paraclostridium bifermentans]NME08994.1 hypothetical protein [Paraclostridium bifermentans]